MTETVFFDRTELRGTRRSEDGYLMADVLVARTGIQDYLGVEIDPDNELGLRDKRVVKVYRPEDEVFNLDSVKTYAHRPVTNDHPPIMVNADNWKQFAVGQTGGDVVRDGDWIRVPLVLMDSAMIADVQSGKRQVSMGYYSVIDATPGTAPDGTQYDAVQRKLRMNHLAVVAAGRAGEKARIGDNRAVEPITTKKEDNMSGEMKTVVLGDKAVQVLATDVSVVENFRAEAIRNMADAEARHKRELADLETTIGTLRADLKKATDAAPGPVEIGKMVAERVQLEKIASSIDSKIALEGRTNDEIRKDCVARVLGDALVKDASEAEIRGMFKAVARDVDTTRSANDDLRTTLAGSGGQVDASLGDAKADYDKALGQSIVNLNAHRSK